MKKAIFIYNALSGDQSISNRLDSIVERFQKNGILIYPYRMYCGDEENLSCLLNSIKFDFAVVSGGDGTLNKVVNILLNNNINIPFGVLPTGTCNDFARSLNLPLTLEECLNVIIRGKILEVDIGLINEEQYFLGTCAGGYFVDVSYNTDSELKRNFGPFAYYLKAVTEVTNKRSFHVKIKTDTEHIKKEILLFMILNGKNAGGFSNIAGEADISDGLMDIVLIKNCNHIDLANLFFKILSNEFSNNKNVTLLKAKSCVIEGDVEVPISVDGDKGPNMPLNVRFLNKELRFFV